MTARKRRPVRLRALPHSFIFAASMILVFSFLPPVSRVLTAAPTPAEVATIPGGPAFAPENAASAPAGSRLQEKPLPQAYRQAPGPLSVAHAAKPGAECAACHDAQNKVPASKCLACHKEIAAETVSQKGFHGDKGDDCAVCHAEHQGPETPLVPLDVKSFDHAETGATLVGAHRRVSDCALCHRPEISFPRAKTKSYILTNGACAACHASPHPGREEKCLACHNQDSWSVDRGGKER